MRRWLVLGVFAAAVWTGCGGGGGGSSTTPAVNTTATPVPAPAATTATQSVALPTPPAAGATVAVTLPAPGGITPTLTLGTGYTAGTQIVVNAANYGQTASYLRSPKSTFSSCPVLVDLTAYVTLAMPTSAVNGFSVAYGTALSFLGTGTFTAQIYDAGATQTSGSPPAPAASNGCGTAPATSSVLATATGTVANGTVTFTNFQSNANLASSLIAKYNLSGGGNSGTIPANAVFGFYVTFVAGATPSPAPTASATPAASPTPTPTATASGTSLQSLYQNAGWQSQFVTVTFPSSCTMKIVTTGAPPTTNPYYLAPASGNQTVVAHTASSNMGLALIPAPTTNLAAVTQTFNICPSKAASTTTTGMGAIGYVLSGEALYNPYEAGGTVGALSDNASYTTTIQGQSVTASFIDQCNSHPTQTSSGTTQWHLHGVPTCLTTQIDGATGPSHVIGIALDGYPIYGGRDINGNVISTSQLDSCNGITSVTPESPNTPIYHYVLPLNTTGTKSSLNCYSGVVSQQVAAAAHAKRQYVCGYGWITAERLAEIRSAALRRRAPTAITYHPTGRAPLSS
jgi:hypothetical protein